MSGLLRNLQSLVFGSSDEEMDDGELDPALKDLDIATIDVYDLAAVKRTLDENVARVRRAPGQLLTPRLKPHLLRGATRRGTRHVGAFEPSHRPADPLGGVGAG